MAQFTNQAQLSYNNAVKNSNIAVGEILEVLSATKTAVENAYGQNDTVTYVINIVNSGTLAFTGLNISDNLGAYTESTLTLTPLEYVPGTLQYYVGGVRQTAPAVTAGPPLVISGITVPAGGNATLIYEARTNQYAPPTRESSISNQAVLRGGGITPITVTETVGAQSAPELCITKSVSPVPVAENGILTYTFLIQNGGNTAAEAGDNVVVTDIFNPVLSEVSVALNGTAWTEGADYTYNETTGEFITTAGRITVPAAAFTQESTTGAWVSNPGVSVLTVTGRV
ncbi:hypothetical protein ACTNCH_00790 [Candidatus Merdisoma sp. HCP28S3_D10]|uniref:hypothetical protein n=1 Tax=unclassified Candidatus Merdisoma TaxID=3099611 RepID=UPI003F8BE612